MNKEQRQNEIIKLITDDEVGSQEELTVKLNEKGVFANQSSVSRDLKKLGIIKIKGAYALPTAPRTGIFGLLKLEPAGDSLIVAKCESGLASAVAVKIDAARLHEIVGTIAGDDTIFIAVRGQKEQTNVLKKVRELFEK